MSHFIIKVIIFGKTKEAISAFIRTNFEPKHANVFQFIAVTDDGESVRYENFKITTVLNPKPRHPITFFMGMLQAIKDFDCQATYMTSFSTKMIFNPGAVDYIIQSLSGFSNESPHIFFMEGDLIRNKDTYYWINTVPYHWPLIPSSLWSELGSFCFYFDTSVAQAIFFQKHLGNPISTISLGKKLLAPYPFSANSFNNPKARYCEQHYQTNGKGLLTFNSFYHLLAVQKCISQMKMKMNFPSDFRKFQIKGNRLICVYTKGSFEFNLEPEDRDFRLFWRGIRRNIPFSKDAKLSLWKESNHQFQSLVDNPVSDLNFRSWGSFYFIWSSATLNSILCDLLDVGGISVDQATRITRFVGDRSEKDDEPQNSFI